MLDWANAKLTALSPKVLAMVVGLRLVSALPAAQEAGSLTETDVMHAAAKGAIQPIADGARELQVKLAATDAIVMSLQKSLAISNSESEVFRRQAGELKLRLEALGTDSASANPIKLEQRLLRVASDYKLADDDRKNLRDSLIRLSEAVLNFQKGAVTSDPDARLALEVEMRGGAKALGVAPPESVSGSPASSALSDGAVISIKDDLALVVANFGSKQGVKVGMPFKVLRDGNSIGSVQVVDVRESIAGAVIQHLNSERGKIEVGDHLKVDAK